MGFLIKKKDPASTIIRFIVFLAFLYIVYLVRDVFTPIIIALILFYVLNPLVSVLSDKNGRGLRLNRTLAILLTVIVFIIAFGLFIQFVAPPIAGEFNNFAKNLPGYVQILENYANQVTTQYSNYKVPAELSSLIAQGIQNVFNMVITFVQSFFSGIFAISGQFIRLIIIPLLVYYMLKDKETLQEGFVNSIPKKYRTKTLKIIAEINKVIRNYIRGIGTLMLIVGTAVTIGLMFLGVKYAIILGIIAGLTEAIPFLGPWLGGAIGVTVALFISPVLALKVLVLYVGVQLLENAVISPRVIGKHLDLHPVIIILAMLILGNLIGAWGLFLAGPITAILRVLYNELKPSV